MDAPPPPVFRFAPSPTGRLHMGHVRSALLNERMAREAGGRLLLRIEDIDPTRCKGEHEAAILDDLAWLGFAWDGPVRRQSAHFEDYATALERLKAMGLVYPTFTSRKDAAALAAAKGPDWPRDPDGVPHYAGPKAQTGEDPQTWRLDMAKAAALAGPLTWREKGETVDARPQDWGDFAIARLGTPTSYHLSVVVDDAAQGVTHVVRGEDLREATSIHRLLQTLLGLPEPDYHHHDLILDEDGRKLSKRDGATSIAHLRESGATPDEVRRLAEGR